jgi:hypothetical protein
MALRATTFLTLDQLKAWCKVTPSAVRSVSGLVAAGPLATATVTNHGFRHGDTVVIAGASPAAYNGSFTISVVDASTFTYTMTSVPASSPATGTITARSDQDALLTLIADRVCAALERGTDRIFALREDLSEVLHGNNRPTLRLAYYPVIAVTSLTIDAVAVPAADYVLEAARGVIRFKTRVFPVGVGNVAVVYDAGYEAGDLPADVVGVALDIAKYYWDRQSSSALATTSISIGGSSINLVADLPRDLRNDVKALMNPRMVA